VTSLTDLRELVDVVIGVDTHVHSHAAAAVDARTGAILDELSVPATAAGYADLVEFANQHSPLRAWALEGTGSHGAGLTRHLVEQEELAIELDRPERSHRRNGAKTAPLDAIRARFHDQKLPAVIAAAAKLRLDGFYYLLKTWPRGQGTYRDFCQRQVDRNN
jgi:transposase